MVLPSAGRPFDPVVGGREGLHDTIFATRQAYSGAGDEHPELRRQRCQPIALVLPIRCKLAWPQGAGPVVDIDDDLDLRGKCAGKRPRLCVAYRPARSLSRNRLICYRRIASAVARRLQGRAEFDLRAASPAANGARCNSLMIRAQSRSLSHCSASSIAISVSRIVGQSRRGHDQIRSDSADLRRYRARISLRSRHKQISLAAAASPSLSSDAPPSSPSSNADIARPTTRITAIINLRPRKLPSTAVWRTDKVRAIPEHCLIRSARFARNT